MNDNTIGNYERNLEQAHNEIAKINKYDDCASYAASLERPATNAYRVLPDGTIEFIR